MKIKDLDYFTQLINLKNFTAVANYFSVSQPTITYAVKRLEAEFETELIVRDQSHQGIIITPSGEQLYRHAQTILKEIALTDKDMARIAATKLKFGLPPIIGTYYFSKLAPKLIQTGVINQFETIEAGSSELLADLEAGRIDAALLGSASPLSTETIQADVIEQHRFKIIVSQIHRWLTADKSDLPNSRINNSSCSLKVLSIHTSSKPFPKSIGFTPRSFIERLMPVFLKVWSMPVLGLAF